MRDAYSLGHFPMLFGIIGFAVGIEEIVAHPGDPLHSEVLIALGTGVALFVGFSAIVYWRISGTILVARLVALLAMAAGLVAVSSLPPAWPLAVVAIALTAVVAWEFRRPPAGELLEDLPSPDRADGRACPGDCRSGDENWRTGRDNQRQAARHAGRRNDRSEHPVARRLRTHACASNGIGQPSPHEQSVNESH